MPALCSEDEILVRAAMDLVRRAELAVADALLVSSTVAVECGDSWSDGFDDYIYDVHVVLTTTLDGSAILTAAGERLRSVFRDTLVLFVDAHGTPRRGDLVRFDLVEATGVIDDERVEQRRAALRESLQDPTRTDRRNQ